MSACIYGGFGVTAVCWVIRFSVFFFLGYVIHVCYCTYDYEDVCVLFFRFLDVRVGIHTFGVIIHTLVPYIRGIYIYNTYMYSFGGPCGTPSKGIATETKKGYVYTSSTVHEYIYTNVKNAEQYVRYLPTGVHSPPIMQWPIL